MNGKLRILSSRGDDEYDLDDVKTKEVFNDLIAKHYAAFSNKGDGQHERISEYDPNAKEIIMVKPLVGG